MEVIKYDLYSTGVNKWIRVHHSPGTHKVRIN